MQVSYLPSDVISRYCPEIRFHSKERYLPCDPDDYIQNSNIFDSSLNIQNNINFLNNDTTNLTLKLKDSVRKSFLYGNENLTEVPVFVVYKRLVDSEDRFLSYEINYFLFFPHNSGGLFNIGSHEGDWEHITVRIDSSFKLQGVYYSNHRSYEGEWLSNGEIPMNKDGRIVAYCAKGSHGFWSSPGYHLRIFGFGNDYTNDNGIRWVPSTVKVVINVNNDDIQQKILPKNIDVFNADLLEVNDESPDVIRDFSDWQVYRGNWGEIHSYRNNGWFGGHEDVRSITPLQRFLNITPAIRK